MRLLTKCTLVIKCKIHCFSSYAHNQSSTHAQGVCFVPVIALVVQGVWMILFVIFKWNKHVVTYTIKDAVFG